MDITIALGFVLFFIAGATLAWYYKAEGVKTSGVVKSSRDDYESKFSVVAFSMLAGTVILLLPILAYFFYDPSLGYLEYIYSAATAFFVLAICYSVALRLNPVENPLLYVPGVLTILFTTIINVNAGGTLYIQIYVFCITVLPIVLAVILAYKFRAMFSSYYDS